MNGSTSSSCSVAPERGQPVPDRVGDVHRHHRRQRRVRRLDVVRERRLGDLVAQHLAHGRDPGDRVGAVVVRLVAPRRRRGEPDPQPPRVGADRGQERPGRRRCAVRVARRRCGDRVEQRRTVAHGARERVDAADGVRERVERGRVRHPAARRLEPEQPARRCGDADGPTAVVAVRDRHHARGDRRRRAAARPARGAAEIVGVVGRSVHHRLGRAVLPELGGVGHAEDDHAGGASPRHRQAVSRGDVVGEQARPAGRREPRHLTPEALHQVGDARERAVESRVGGLGPRLVEPGGDDRTHRRVPRLDASDGDVHHLGRGHVTAADRRRQAQAVELVVPAVPHRAHPSGALTATDRCVPSLHVGGNVLAGGLGAEGRGACRKGQRRRWASARGAATSSRPPSPAGAPTRGTRTSTTSPNSWPGPSAAAARRRRRSTTAPCAATSRTSTPGASPAPRSPARPPRSAPTCATSSATVSSTTTPVAPCGPRRAPTGCLGSSAATRPSTCSTPPPRPSTSTTTGRRTIPSPPRWCSAISPCSRSSTAPGCGSPSAAGCASPTATSIAAS